MSKFIEGVKVSSALDYASGTADRTGTILDMSGYEGVLMIVKLATVAANATVFVRAQQDSAAAMGSAAYVAGTQQAIDAADDNDIVVIDLYQPTERYVRVHIDKDGSNACAESAVYVQYNAAYKPVTTAVADSVYVKAPSERPSEGTP